MKSERVCFEDKDRIFGTKEFNLMNFDALYVDFGANDGQLKCAKVLQIRILASVFAKRKKKPEKNS